MTLVSQFTLFAKLIRGKRPDFHDAMNPATAKKLYEDFIELLKAEMEAKEKYSSIRVKTGVFGEIMDIELQNKVSGKKRFIKLILDKGTGNNFS